MSNLHTERQQKCIVWSSLINFADTHKNSGKNHLKSEILLLISVKWATNGKVVALFFRVPVCVWIEIFAIETWLRCISFSHFLLRQVPVRSKEPYGDIIPVENNYGKNSTLLSPSTHLKKNSLRGNLTKQIFYK